MGNTILIAEDDPKDVFLLEQAFADARVPARLQFVRDGQEAIDYLQGKAAYADRQLHPLPSLILLDLKMPRLNGFDVLNWLQLQSALKAVPVTVLTSSGQSIDVERAYAAGANSYLVKPHGLAALTELANSVNHYWFKLNHGPALPRPVL